MEMGSENHGYPVPAPSESGASILSPVVFLHLKATSICYHTQAIHVREMWPGWSSAGSLYSVHISSPNERDMLQALNAASMFCYNYRAAKRHDGMKGLTKQNLNAADVRQAL